MTFIVSLGALINHNFSMIAQLLHGLKLRLNLQSKLRHEDFRPLSSVRNAQATPPGF